MPLSDLQYMGYMVYPDLCEESSETMQDFLKRELEGVSAEEAGKMISEILWENGSREFMRIATQGLIMLIKARSE